MMGKGETVNVGYNVRKKRTAVLKMLTKSHTKVIAGLVSYLFIII